MPRLDDEPCFEDDEDEWDDDGFYEMIDDAYEPDDPKRLGLILYMEMIGD